MLSYSVGIHACSSRRTPKLRSEIATYRSQSLKIGGGCASGSRSHGAIRLHCLLKVGTSLVRLRLVNKFGSFGRVAASRWVINGMEVLIIREVGVVAVRLHAKIQNLRASVLLDRLKGGCIVTIILLVTIFRVGLGVVDATVDLQHVLLFQTIRWHF